MKSLTISLMLLMGSILAGYYPAVAQEQNLSHVHIRHITIGWSETPGQEGLLPTAVEEAKIADQHAEFAIEKPEDLENIKTHVEHVMHAIDPDSVELSAPGLGYGVLPAAEGIARHIQLAADAPDASDNVQLHATHVKTSAENVIQWSEDILALGTQAQQSEDAATAIDFARAIHGHTQAILEGRDANDDDQITWQEGEGGLRQVAKHMGLMREGEGLE